MARSELKDARGPLARALGNIAKAGPAGVLEPLWAEVVGALSSRSRPVRLHDGVLTVESDPQFLAFLERDRAVLIERLNARLGRRAVRQLLFVSEGARTP